MMMQWYRARRLATLLVILAAAGQTTAAERLWTYSTPAGFLDSSPAIGDVDRDGSPDIVVTSTAGLVFALDAQGHVIWQIVQATRREIAKLLAALRRHP